MRSVFVPEQGRWLYVDAGNSLGMGQRPYEPDLVAFFQQEIATGDVVVDAGAMCGFYTVLFSNLVGSDGRVLAFEPNTKSFDVLEMNCAWLNNVTAVRAALKDSNGECWLSVTDLPGDCRAYRMAGWQTQRISCMRLDSLDLHRLDAIKMDVQGGETDALIGAEGLLSKFDPIIVLEFAPEWLRAAGSGPQELVDLLHRHRYDLCVPGGEVHNDLEWWMENLPGGHTGFTNMVCRRRRS